jgi:serine/threonine protein kinase
MKPPSEQVTEQPVPRGREPSLEARMDRADSHGTSDDGPTLGRYRLRAQLGAGAMGAVFEAEDTTLGRTVALKVLHRELSEQDRQRIQREALALARLSHPNVVHLYEIGREEERTFIAMELVRGRTLDHWQRERPPWRECLGVYLQAGQGLAAAHAVGLVHRDFKPSNCIVGDDGRVRVLDFGLARAVEQDDDIDGREEGEGKPVTKDAPLGARLTQTGAVVGTVAYMPLELLMGSPASVASDQFGFCVSLYEIHPRGSQPRDTTRLLAETLGILRGCPLVRSGRESTWVDGIRHRSSKTLLDGTARDRGGLEGVPSQRQRAPVPRKRNPRRRASWARDAPSQRQVGP